MHFILYVVIVVLAFGCGFGVGRIKNAGKLASIRAELDCAKSTASVAVHEWIRRVEEHL